MSGLPPDDGSGYPPQSVNPQTGTNTGGISGTGPNIGYGLTGYTSGGGFDAGGCSSGICDCIGDALESIAASQYRIANALEEQLNGLCGNVDKCIDQIIYSLKKKLEHGAKTCEECKSLAAAGGAGTLEYAISCANACVGETEVICSLGSPENEGKHCKGCGKEPCCCDKGVCKPCPEDETPAKRFIGWCDSLTGVIIVTKEGAEPPGPTYVPAAPAESEQVAFQEAERYCRQRNDSIFIPKTDEFPDPAKASRYCDIGSYITGRSVNDLGSGVGLTNKLAGAQRAMNAIGGVGLAGINLNNIGEVVAGAFSASFGAPMLITADFADLLGKLMGCDNDKYKNMIKALSSFDVLQKMMGSDFSEFLEPYRYAMRAECPYKMLSPDQAMAAFFADTASASDLAGYWSIAGYCPGEYKRMLAAGRAKPVPQQLSLMRMRGIIDNSQYRTGMRQLGYLETEVQENLHKLFQQLPPMSEIIRYMVRDAADEQLVSQFGLDDLFERKYTGQLKKWGEQQGIPEELAKFSWRAHWIIPAPGQLFEMLHRLRKNPAYGGEAAFLKIVKDALAQQDIAPYWQDKFIAISYRPLGRVDIRRAFNIGAIQQKDLLDLYSQLGYDDATCAKLEKFSIRLRDLSAASHKAVKLYNNWMLTKPAALARMVADGLPQAVASQALTDSEMAFKSSTVAMAFANGEIDLPTFKGELTNHGVDPASITAITRVLSYKRTASPALLDYQAGLMTNAAASGEMLTEGVPTLAISILLQRADRIAVRQQTLDCMRGLRRRYMTGEFDKQQVTNEVIKAGILNPQANNLVNAWSCHKSALGKQVPAAKLCKWLSIGIIDSAEFLKRLQNVGYSQQTANMMLSDCMQQLSVQRQKLAEKQSKEMLAAARRAAAEGRRAAATAASREKQLANARKKQATIRQNRDTQQLKASENVMLKAGISLTEAINTIRETISGVQHEYGLTLDQTLQIVMVASEKWPGGDVSEYVAAVGALANAASHSDFTPALDDVLP